MKKSIIVNVNSKPYQVVIEDINTSPIIMMVNGKTYQVTIEESEMTSKSVFEEFVATPTIELKAPTTVPLPSAQPIAVSADAVTSPMPGTILGIAVKSGDKVTHGQLLCYLEAMKMKSAIRSPREGIIASVDVTDDLKVPHGQVLFRYERGEV